MAVLATPVTLDRELADEGDILDVWNDVKVQPFFPVNHQGANPDAFRAFKNLQDKCPDLTRSRRP